MLLKHVYMGLKFQRTLKLDISLSLEHFFISVANFTQVASAPLKCLIYFGYWRKKHWKYLVLEKDAKADIGKKIIFKS